MKKGLIFAALIMAGSVYAGCGTCGPHTHAKKETKKEVKKEAVCPASAARKSACGAASKCPMASALKGIELTEDQQKAIAKARAKFKKKVEKILTKEQLTKMKANCAAAGGKCSK